MDTTDEGYVNLLINGQEFIKRVRQKTGLSQVMYAGSLGVSPKIVEAWENGRNKPEGVSRRLLELVRV